jgi:ammonium transporter Rh
MVGTLFLFMYWPSFNSAPAATPYLFSLAQHNTIFAITASVITAVLVSRMMFGKLNMEIMLNATLAGGVVMGSSADLIEEPFVSILVGSLTGIISAFGFAHLGHIMKGKINLADTCGVLYLHGIPGFLGGLLSVLYLCKEG